MICITRSTRQGKVKVSAFPSLCDADHFVDKACHRAAPWTPPSWTLFPNKSLSLSLVSKNAPSRDRIAPLPRRPLPHRIAPRQRHRPQKAPSRQQKRPRDCPQKRPITPSKTPPRVTESPHDLKNAPSRHHHPFTWQKPHAPRPTSAKSPHGSRDSPVPSKTPHLKTPHHVIENAPSRDRVAPP